MRCLSVSCVVIGFLVNPGTGPLFAYDDDDLLCRDGEGFSPRIYQQQLLSASQARQAEIAASQAAFQHELRLEQHRQEMIRKARRTRFEKEARRRQQAIAKRQAAQATVKPATPRPR